MSYGIIGYSANGGANQPSPSIWGDCASQELLDEGTGFFTYQEWVDAPVLPGLPNATAGAANVSVLYNTAYNSVLQITTGTTAGNAAMLFTRPLAPIAVGSGIKYWAEIEFALDSVTRTQGFFFGLIGGPVLVAGVNKLGGLPVTAATNDLKAGVVNTASTTRTSNTITTNSLIGIVGTPTGSAGQVKFDALYLNQPTYSATPTALPATTSTIKTVGTPVYIQTDLLNSPSIAANINAPGNTNLSTNGLVSTTTLNGIPGDLTAFQPTPNTTLNLNNGFVKLGIRYDGQQYLYFYVNGVQAARVQVDSTFDQVSNYGTAVSITNTAGTSSSVIELEFFRAAAKIA